MGESTPLMPKKKGTLPKAGEVVNARKKPGQPRQEGF